MLTLATISNMKQTIKDDLDPIKSRSLSGQFCLVVIANIVVVHGMHPTWLRYNAYGSVMRELGMDSHAERGNQG